MHLDTHDNRGRWIIICGVIGAVLGAGTHQLSIAIALGVAAGMTIGTLINKTMPHRHR